MTQGYPYKLNMPSGTEILSSVTAEVTHGRGCFMCPSSLPFLAPTATVANHHRATGF